VLLIRIGTAFYFNADPQRIRLRIKVLSSFNKNFYEKYFSGPFFNDYCAILGYLIRLSSRMFCNFLLFYTFFQFGKWKPLSQAHGRDRGVGSYDGATAGPAASGVRQAG
jgi:hypothetical protein